MPPSTREESDRIKQIAYLLSKNWKQDTIAETLGIAQSSVSRARATAVRLGYIEKLVLCNFDEAEVKELLIQINRPQLLEALQELQPRDAPHLRRLRVLRSDRFKPSGSEQQINRYRDDIGRYAAEHLVDYVFPHIESLGVTWGGTLLTGWDSSVDQTVNVAPGSASAGRRHDSV